VRASGGRTSVDELARAVGLSARQLERRFRARVGLGPKLLARITRFQHAFRLARRTPNLAEVAARAGYFDQAHLVRDFRQFAGAAPSRFLAREHELARQFAG
jgi:AraC-like DNA-binding protein